MWVTPDRAVKSTLEKKTMNTHEDCPDCGTDVGQPHRNNCDIERCSVCGRQRFSCGCEGHDPTASAWTEMWPTEDDVAPEDDFFTALTGFPNGFAEQKRNLPSESEGLEPLIGHGFVIGFESDINGPDAELVAFQPTRAELKTLAHHYLERYFRVQGVHAMGMSGSFEIREEAFSLRRFCSIAEALNPNEPVKEFQEYIAKKWASIDEWERENVPASEQVGSFEQVSGTTSMEVTP